MGPSFSARGQFSSWFLDSANPAAKAFSTAPLVGLDPRPVFALEVVKGPSSINAAVEKHVENYEGRAECKKFFDVTMAFQQTSGSQPANGVSAWIPFKAPSESLNELQGLRVFSVFVCTGRRYGSWKFDKAAAWTI